MEWITKTELIAKMDAMSIEESREIINKTKEREGYVDYQSIFETMGYVHAFNNTYKKA